jgi:hypothetical protein
LYKAGNFYLSEIPFVKFHPANKALVSMSFVCLLSSAPKSNPTGIIEVVQEYAERFKFVQYYNNVSKVELAIYYSGEAMTGTSRTRSGNLGISSIPASVIDN